MRLFGLEIEFVDKEKEGSNRDALRDMDNSELAYFIVNHRCPPGLLLTKECSETDCETCWVKWLGAERGKTVSR